MVCVVVLKSLNKNQDVLISDYSLRVIDKENIKSLYPIGVISLLPKVQARIGQSYSSFLEYLSIANLFIILQPVYDKEAVKIFYVIKMKSNGIETEPLGALTVYKDTIISYQFNQKSKLSRAKLSAIQQLRFKGTINQVAVQAVQALSALTNIKMSSDKWGTKVDKDSVSIYLKLDNMLPTKNRLYYYISKGSDDSYFINTVGYKLEDIKKAEK